MCLFVCLVYIIFYASFPCFYITSCFFIFNCFLCFFLFIFFIFFYTRLLRFLFIYSKLFTKTSWRSNSLNDFIFCNFYVFVEYFISFYFLSFYDLLFKLVRPRVLIIYFSFSFDCYSLISNYKKCKLFPILPAIKPYNSNGDNHSPRK